MPCLLPSYLWLLTADRQAIITYIPLLVVRLPRLPVIVTCPVCLRLVFYEWWPVLASKLTELITMTLGPHFPSPSHLETLPPTLSAEIRVPKCGQSCIATSLVHEVISPLRRSTLALETPFCLQQQVPSETSLLEQVPNVLLLEFLSRKRSIRSLLLTLVSILTYPVTRDPFMFASVRK